MNCPIYDSFDTDYKSPFGAVERLSKCSFSLRIPLQRVVDEAVMVVFRPGFKEKYINLEQTDETKEYRVFSTIYSPQDVGLHHYYFMITVNGHKKYIKRKDASIGALEGEELFQLTVYQEGMKTPDWIKGGVMYQIFPDRFSRAKGLDSDPEPPSDRKYHTSWRDIPDWRPDEKGIIRNNDFFGGNLRGINEKLDYLKNLGVTVIYLNPIFESHENHRYSTACYERIDPLLGTEKDFRELCASAKEKGIRIILDGVFSHTGADSVYFNKFGRYGGHEGAYRNPESKYREWYSFIRYPEEYESWWGITTLPNVNENAPSYTEYICGEGGILQRWLDAGASGWRLDVADELPDDFLDNLRISVKSKGEDKIVYGEVWEDASNKESYGQRRRYLTGRQLDSVMNYPFKECILNYIKYGDPTPFVNGIMTIIEHYPKPCVDTLMNFLSTHDTERAITRLAGEDVGWHDREWQAVNKLSPAQYSYGVSLMRCAMVLQFFLPGIPCVYYGDEAGQEGYKDPFNRRTYPWYREDENLIRFTSELSRIRKMSKVFCKGTLKFLDVTPEHCVMRRSDVELGQAAVIVLNKSPKGKCWKLGDIIGPCRQYSFVRSGSRERGRLVVSPYDYEVVFITL